MSNAAATTTSSPGNNPYTTDATIPDHTNELSHLGYRGIFWLTLGSLVIPIYIVACILSVIKAHSDRKLIKARIMARKLKQPIETPLDIIAKEVRKNKWHKRQSSMALSKIQSLLKHTNENWNSCGGDDLRTSPHQEHNGRPDLRAEPGADELYPVVAGRLGVASKDGGGDGADEGGGVGAGGDGDSDKERGNEGENVAEQ